MVSAESRVVWWNVKTCTLYQLVLLKKKVYVC